jgi:predicted CoA-binding protein
MGNIENQIEQFLLSKAFGVVGVSKDRNKYGNKVLRCYLQQHKVVYPVHPTEENIENIRCLSKITDLPSEVESLSIITPPPITEKIVEQAIAAKHIKNIWMQPGAENIKAVEACKEHKVNIIYGGPCLLVMLGYHE